MLMSNLSLTFYFFYILSFLLVISEANNFSALHQKNVVMFVFGDSIFDPGNENFLNVSYTEKADRWPYGETFFKKPTGRFCDGRIIPDFIAEYAKIPYWKPYLEPAQEFTYGANFAAAGAAILPQTNQGEIHLDHQLNFFKMVASDLKQELGEKEANEMLMEAIYLSSIGGSDLNFYAENYVNATKSDQEQFVQLLIANLTGVIQEIYEMGGRKFAFQNVGPIGCLPVMKQVYGVIGNSCLERPQLMAKLYNNALLQAAKLLEKQLQGFQYLVFDYFTLLYNIIQDPSKYGFQTAEVACCGSGIFNGEDCGIAPFALCSNVSEYVFFDGGHPTEKVNIQLTEFLWNGTSPITTPYNFKQLAKLSLSSKNKKLFNDE